MIETNVNNKKGNNKIIIVILSILLLVSLIYIFVNIKEEPIANCKVEPIKENAPEIKEEKNEYILPITNINGYENTSTFIGIKDEIFVIGKYKSEDSVEFYNEVLTEAGTNIVAKSLALVSENEIDYFVLAFSEEGYTYKINLHDIKMVQYKNISATKYNDNKIKSLEYTELFKRVEEMYIINGNIPLKLTFENNEIIELHCYNYIFW